MMRWLLGLSLAGSLSAATTVTVRPSSSTANSGDAYTSAAAPAGNFGTAGALVVSGPSNAKGAFQSILRFDLASVKSSFDAAYGAGNWSLDSVALELTAATPLNVSFNANAAGLVLVEWLADDSWLENTVTWNSMPAVIAAGSESLGSLNYDGANSGTYQAHLTSSTGLNADLAAGSTASIRVAAGDALVSMVTNSRNFATAANRPALIFTASPEPARGLFCLVGVMIVLMRRRASKALEHDLPA